MFYFIKKCYNNVGDILKNSILYSIVRPIVTIYFKIFYRPKYIGRENIPKNGRIILAGNHKNNLDCIYLMSSTKRPVHFLAKKELFVGFKKILFGNLGLIPVDRKNKSHGSIELAEKYLESEKMIGIFPEGTFNRSDDTILPFKIGAVKMSYDTNSKIVPFTIKGDYKLFSKNLVIEFLKPIEAKNKDLEKDNQKLEKIIRNNLEG